MARRLGTSVAVWSDYVTADEFRTSARIDENIDGFTDDAASQRIVCQAIAWIESHCGRKLLDPDIRVRDIDPGLQILVMVVARQIFENPDRWPQVVYALAAPYRVLISDAPEAEPEPTPVPTPTPDPEVPALSISTWSIQDGQRLTVDMRRSGFPATLSVEYDDDAVAVVQFSLDESRGADSWYSPGGVVGTRPGLASGRTILAYSVLTPIAYVRVVATGSDAVVRLAQAGSVSGTTA